MRNILVFLVLLSLRGLSQGNPFFVNKANALKVPIALHVLYDDNRYNIDVNEIYEQMDTVTAHFEGSGILPQLASLDQNDRNFERMNRMQLGTDNFISFKQASDPTNGGYNGWSRDDYLNIWAVAMDSGIMGYAWNPFQDSILNGIVINSLYFGVGAPAVAPYDNGKLLVDLIGQYLGIAERSKSYGFSQEESKIMRSVLVNRKTELALSQKSDSIGSIQLRIDSVIYEPIYCDSDVPLKIYFSNVGTDTLFSFQLSLNGDVITISKELNPGESDFYALNYSLDSAKSIAIQWVNDFDIDWVYEFSVNTGEFEQMPYSFDVEKNHPIYNSDQFITWNQHSNLLLSDGTYGTAYGISNHLYEDKTQEDILYLGNVTLSGDSPKLLLSYAYAKFNGFNSEEMVLEYSSDCWVSAKEIYRAKGSSLQTVSFSQSEYWEPESSKEWKELVFDMSHWEAIDISLRIRIINGYGNNFYLESVKVVDSVFSLSSLEELNDKLNVYPSVSNDVFNVRIPSPGVLAVYNVAGQIVRSETFLSNEGTISLSLNSIPAGLYYLRWSGRNRNWISKIYKR